MDRDEETAFIELDNGQRPQDWSSEGAKRCIESAPLLLPASMGAIDPEGGSGGDEESGPLTMTIKRRVLTRDSMNQLYASRQEHISWRDIVRDKCQCSGTRVLHTVLGYVPLISVLRHYRWKADSLNDFMAGLSASFMHLPQGLAIGLLASLPPVYGLYTTLFPVICYMIFGTSAHTSIGSNAVIALLTANIIEKELDLRLPPEVDTTVVSPVSPMDTILTTQGGGGGGGGGGDKTVFVVNAVAVDEELAFKVGIASAVAFLSGVYLSIAGFLKLGFVTSYLSTSFVGGFTTAASFHILTSQVSKLFNIKVKAYSGAGKVVKTYVEIFKSIGDANPGDVVVSIVSIIFLLTITILINERYKEKLKVPIPVELLLVIISTFISHFAGLQEKFGIAVVGDIPRGLPRPSVPDMGSLSRIASDSFVVAVLTFTISISLAKLTAKMHNYSIDDNQEFLAYGLSNLICSFFSCFTCCNAPPRAMILSNVGAKTTFNSVSCIIFILLILLAAGQLFFALPVAVLAAMICVAMKNLLLQTTQLPFLWRTSKPDFVIWVLTCLVSVLGDLDLGIMVGIGVSVLTVIVKSQVVSGSVGGVSSKEDLITLSGNREGVKKSTQFAIFYFPSQVYFANAETFKKELFSKVVHPNHLQRIKDDKGKGGEDNLGNGESGQSATDSDNEYKDLKYIVLECSAMTYMDLAGANTIKSMAESYHKVNVTVLLTNCPEYSLSILEKVGYFEKLSLNTVYHDIYDAVNFIQQTLSLPIHNNKESDS